MGEFPYIVAYQDNVRGVHGNVTAYASHRNSGMGGFQGRSVIDSVPDHAHPVPFLLECVNPVELVLRQAVRVNPLNA